MGQVKDVIRDINKGEETAAGKFMDGVSESIIDGIAEKVKSKNKFAMFDKPLVQQKLFLQ